MTSAGPTTAAPPIAPAGVVGTTDTPGVQDAAAPGARRRVLAAGAAASLGAGLSGASVAVNGALRHFPTLSGQSLRYAMGALSLAAYARLRRRPLPRLRRQDVMRLVLLAATGLAGFNIFVLAALDHAEPAAIGVIVGCVPVVIAVAEPLSRRSRPAAATVGATVVVAAGAALVQGGGDVSLVGVLLACGALACEVAFTLLAVPVMPRLGPLGVSTWACVMAATMLALAAPLVHGGMAFTAPTAGETAAILVLGTVVTAVAFVAWYSSVDAVGPVRTGLFAGLAPVGTLLAATAMDGHLPHVAELTGTLVVGAGITLGVRSARPTHS
jgi:drug/metabolite transporter (DMT)-like permease